MFKSCHMKIFRNFRKITICLVCALLLANNNAYGQVLITNTTPYKARSYDEMIAPYILATQEYNRLEADINNLKGKVSSILGQKVDTEMRQNMNNEFQNLNALSEELSRNGMRGIRDKYNAILQRINSEVVYYENRVAIAELEEKRSIAIERAANDSRNNNQSEWCGTCFAIGDKWVVTNYHVVENARDIVICGENVNYSAEIVLTDKYNDLAIMRIANKEFPGFKIKYGVNFKVSEIGTDVFVLGYPLIQTMGENVKLTTGVISSKTGFKGDVSLYQISAPIQPGNSGGPLFDNAGNLIGIVSAKHKEADNVGYAIKINYLKNLIDSSDEKISLNYNNTIATASLAEKVKKISSCVLLVKVNANTPTININSIESSSIILEYDKELAQLLFQSAKWKCEKKDFEGAYKDICKSVKYYSTVETQYLLGSIAWYRTNDVDRAIESFIYCLEKGYKKKDCASFLTTYYISRNEYSKAIPYLDIAIASNGKNVAALELRGICKAKIGQEDGAINDYMQAANLDGIVDYDYSNIYNNIAYHMMNKEKYDYARIYIEKSLKHNNLYGNAWDTYGELNYHMKNYEECIRAMNIAITNGEINEGAWIGNSYFYRALAKKELGNLAGAYKDLKEAIELKKEEAIAELETMEVTVIDFSDDGSYNKMIVSPNIKRKKTSTTEIRGIEITNEYTAIHMCYKNARYDNGGWYSINREAYIIDKSTGKKYPLITTKNCAISPHKTNIEKNEVKDFILYFESIPIDTKDINLIESNKSTWNFFGIRLYEKNY